MCTEAKDRREMETIREILAQVSALPPPGVDVDGDHFPPLLQWERQTFLYSRKVKIIFSQLFILQRIAFVSQMPDF